MIEETGPRFRGPLLVLGVVVVFVWLIACLNLSNLMLARAAKRQREFALRLAVGAGRGRLLRQMLTESFLLAAMGTALGVLFALWTSRLLTAWLSTSRDPVSLDIRTNAAVLGYTAGITILTTLLFRFWNVRRNTVAPTSLRPRWPSRSPTWREYRGFWPVEMRDFELPAARESTIPIWR
jgi:predicted lysophospholipase L1 biosynthesis ABC-type transport system permease subunit